MLPLVPIAVGVIAAIALAFRVFRLLQRSKPRSAYVNFIVGCGLFAVAAAPVVLVSQFTVTFRIMFTMTGIELLLFFWVLNFLPLAGSVLASVIAAFAIGAAFVSVYGTAASNAMEYALSRRAVAHLVPNEFHSIMVLRRALPRRACGLPLRGDFAGLSPIPHIFDQLIGSRYVDDPDKFPSFDVEEIYIRDDGADPVLEKNATVVDLSAVYGQSPITDFSQFATVAATPRGLGPANAVDQDPSTFWEAVGAFPMTLEIDYPAARTLVGYRLSTEEEPDRMPDRWEVWVSEDLVNWRRIQEATQEGPWKLAQTRSYGVEPTADVRGIKLVTLDTDKHSILRLYEFTPKFERSP